MADDWLNRWNGAQQAQAANQPQGMAAAQQTASQGWLGQTVDNTYVGGFLNSAISTLPEMFGQNPTPQAQAFRDANPVGGVVSSLAAGLIPYGGIELAVARLPKLAAAVEGGTALAGRGFGLAKSGITAAENPIAYGAVKEMVKFAPFELGRLGVGLATAPSENYGDLLADVGLSTVLAGGFGGIGGYFRSGGKLLPDMGRVVGADFALRPTFELRMAATPGAEVSGSMSLADARQTLMQQVLTETPSNNLPAGVKGRYVQDLEGGSPETDGLVNQLFKVDRTKGTLTGLDRRLLTESDASNLRTLDRGQQQEVLGALGLPDMETLASSVVYPRQVEVRSARAAGTLAKAFDDSTALQYVGDGVLMGREADSGLFVFAKRIKAGGNGADGETQISVRAGDLIKYAVHNGGAGQEVTAARAAENAALRASVAEKGVNEPLLLDIDSKRGQARLANGNHRAVIANELDPNMMVPVRVRQSSTLKRGLTSGVKYDGEFGQLNTGQRYGAAQIAEGDKWIIGKTDKPQLFAKEAHLAAEETTRRTAMYREAFQPFQKDDVWNQSADAMLRALTPADYSALRSTPRKTWTSKVADKMAKSLGEATDLAGSKTLHDTANFLYDTFSPTMFKEAKNSAFGRLFGLLRGNMMLSDEYVSKLVRGKAVFESTPLQAVTGKMHFESGYEGFDPIGKLWSRLSPDERQLVVRASNTQTPAEDLAKLTHDGVISDNASQVVKQLQNINKSVWEKLLLPAFKGTELEGTFNLLDGYILPRVFKGDFYSRVTDDLGRTQWLAVGKTGVAAQKEAQAVIEEATSRGLKWKVSDEFKGGAKHAMEVEGSELQGISDLVNDRIGKGKETQDVVQAALRRLDAARQGGGRTTLPGRPGKPGALTNSRTGISGSPDAHTYSLDDVVKQSEDHYRRLLRFAAYHTWKRRWGQEAFNLASKDKTAYTDLMRKANQFMGIEGQITNTLNKTLEPLLGNVLGGKPATRIAQATNALMYNWNLAIANPTFALLNLLQPLQTVAPWIAYTTRASSDEVAKHMHFLPAYDAEGKARGVAQAMSPMKVLGASLQDLRKPSPELKQMLERATTDGTLQHSQVDEWVGEKSAAGTTIRETFQHQGGWEGIKKIATYMAEKSENYSRMISFNAAYRVGKYHFGLEGDQLYRFTQRGVHVTNYGYSVVDRSRMFTGPLGSTFGLFKNWQFNFIGQMMQYAGVGMKEGVWAPFLWQGASALALGGIGATPLLGLANGLAQWKGDSPSSFLWMQENWNKDAADAVYFGLPSFFGASLQASSTIPGTDVRNEVSSLMNFVFLERAKQVGKAVGTAWQIGTEGNMNALRNPNVRDQMLAALAPRAIFRAVSAVEGDYIKSMSTGYPQVKNLGPAAQMMHALGLNQVEVERNQVAARELFNDQEATRYAVQGLGLAYADAMKNQDMDEMQRIINRTMAAQLPLDSVMKSAQTRNKRETQQDMLSRFDGAQVARYRAAIQE